MGTNTPHTYITGLLWQKQARRFSQIELKVGDLGFPIHFVCVSVALYHWGHAAVIFPLGEYGPFPPSVRKKKRFLIKYALSDVRPSVSKHLANRSKLCGCSRNTLEVSIRTQALIANKSGCFTVVPNTPPSPNQHPVFSHVEADK